MKTFIYSITHKVKLQLDHKTPTTKIADQLMKEELKHFTLSTIGGSNGESFFHTDIIGKSVLKRINKESKK